MTVVPYRAVITAPILDNPSVFPSGEKNAISHRVFFFLFFSYLDGNTDSFNGVSRIFKKERKKERRNSLRRKRFRKKREGGGEGKRKKGRGIVEEGKLIEFESVINETSRRRELANNNDNKVERI